MLDVIRDVAAAVPRRRRPACFWGSWGEGGNAAWDIGLSRRPVRRRVADEQPAEAQLHNSVLAQRPEPAFYVVTGDMAGDSFKHIHAS